MYTGLENLQPLGPDFPGQQESISKLNTAFEDSKSGFQCRDFLFWFCFFLFFLRLQSTKIITYICSVSTELSAEIAIPPQQKARELSPSHQHELFLHPALSDQAIMYLIK